MARGDNIAKVGKTLIGVDEEHRERDVILDSIKNRKPIEAGKREVTWLRARRPMTNRATHSEDAEVVQ